ncbi:MAG: fatty acid desaturase [Thioalkalivibrio sp.]
MNTQTVNGEMIADPRALRRALNAYRTPSLVRSVMEMLITALSFALVWVLMFVTLSAGHWVGLLLAVPAAGFLVRLFMIQHDCSHGSFFRSRRVNDWVGRVIGVLTLTPYGFWRHCHLVHHANSGNLDRSTLGGIDTLTVREFWAMPWGQRLRYRLYRHPFVIFGLGPAYLFLLRNRLPIGFMGAGATPWLSTMGTNVAIAVVVSVMVWWLGAATFFLVQLPITLLAASIGVWLFYVQHQFEETLWAHDEGWTFEEAALRGSSHYDLPGVLRWFTANIGVHHVHHLCSRIPFYRLPEVLREHPQLRNAGRLTLRQSLGTMRLTLWDEERRRLVPFAVQADRY